MFCRKSECPGGGCEGGAKSCDIEAAMSVRKRVLVSEPKRDGKKKNLLGACCSLPALPVGRTFGGDCCGLRVLLASGTGKGGAEPTPPSMG